MWGNGVIVLLIRNLGFTPWSLYSLGESLGARWIRGWVSPIDDLDTLMRRKISWWTKWQWDKFFSKYFGFSLSVSFHQLSIFVHSSVTNTIISMAASLSNTFK
jgi:hypothetical protein